MAEDRPTRIQSLGSGGGEGESKNGGTNATAASAESEEIASMLQKAALDDEINELGRWGHKEGKGD